MTKTAKHDAKKHRRVSARYLALVQQFPLRPIQSDDDLTEASAVIDSLLDQKKLTAGEQDYLHVLSNLVEEYEDEHHQIAPLPDGEMLRHLIEANDLKQVELARATGIVDTTISAVLAGKRTLTREQVGKLSQYFHVSPEAFAFG
jgi:HTH-type transcriptional regulator/antitoxin HigA